MNCQSLFSGQNIRRQAVFKVKAHFRRKKKKKNTSPKCHPESLVKIKNAGFE